uniref:Xylulose kinase-1 n=1 Tax=Tanacetum cinerariifolium TaxID=118510 RepID=A0A6L2L9J5_TANCI|nr:xylulose kinase-1 [Tanacetum cinerariifolium]
MDDDLCKPGIVHLVALLYILMLNLINEVFPHKTLEANFFEFVQTNQFAGAVSSILGIVQRYMDQRMNEAVKTKMKNPQLNQTGGPRGEEKEMSQSQQALQRRKRPGQLASLHKGPNLNKRLQTSLHQQRSQCRLLKIWKSPHIKSLKQISGLAKQTDSPSSFNELMDTPVDFSAFIINRLKVDTLTPEFLAGPTYELMKGSCKSLVELEFFLEEVYKATTDHDGTLNDVRTALDDRLKGIRMKYLPQTIWRKSEKERAATMIQAIDKQLNTRRIMRSLEKFIGGRLKLKDEGESTYFQLSQRFVIACSYLTIMYKDIMKAQVIQNGNSLKRTRRGSDRGLIILPLTTAEEHLVVQRESKARTTLLQSIPDDHIADFHYMDDARDIWNFRISETEGFHKGYDRMQKIMSQLNQLNVRPDTEEINPSATSTNKNMSYGDSLTHSSTTTYYVPSNTKTGSYRTGNVIEDVLQLLVADTEPEQQLAYKDLEQIEKLDLEEMDLKWQMAMLFVRVYKFEQKAGRKIDFDKKESARFNKQKVKEIGKKEEDSKALITVDTLVDWSNHDSGSDEVIAAKEFGMIAGCDSADVIKAGANKLYNLINGANLKEANTPGDAGEFALMGVTSEKELGWDDSAFSVFTTTSEDVEGRRTFQRFAKTDSIKAVPPPLTRDYTSLSDHTDLDESQMSYGTKSLTSCDPKSMPNDYVSCDDSDKSSEDNTNDLAFSDSAKIDSNVRTSTKEPISVQDFPSFTCNSSDKNEHSSRTSCNKHGSFNKKAGHFKKYSLSVSKLCFVCVSGTHLMQDYDFYEKQITNTTVDPTIRPQPVPTGTPKVKPVSIVPTGKLKATPVPTGRLHRPFPVATDRGCSPSVPSGTHGLSNKVFSGFGCCLTTTQQMVFNSPCLTDKKELIHHEVPTGRYVVSTGRVIVPASRYIVPTGSAIVATGSVFTTTSKDVKGRPTFHRFAKTDSMKVVPPPLIGDYTSLSDHSDLDESQMYYGTKSLTSNDPESVTNDFVSYDNNDKSSEDNTSDFASYDSSGNSSEHKPTEIESNVRTPIKEPINV